MDINDIKRQIKDNIRFESISSKSLGGQSCGITRSKQCLISEDLDLRIELNYYRGIIENRKLLLTLFDLTLDELIK